MKVRFYENNFYEEDIGYMEIYIYSIKIYISNITNSMFNKHGQTKKLLILMVAENPIYYLYDIICAYLWGIERGYIVGEIRLRIEWAARKRTTKYVVLSSIESHQMNCYTIGMASEIPY